MLERNKWCEFTAFKQALDDRLSSIDSADYFCDPANKWLREAWIAGAFGQHARVTCIRLASEGDWPDRTSCREGAAHLHQMDRRQVVWLGSGKQ